MSPEEKAKELVDKFTVVGLQQRAEGYQCALIAVDEIIKSSPATSPGNDSSDFMPHFKAVIFWEQVKQEIEKL